MTPDPFALVARALRDLAAPSSDHDASPALDLGRTRNLLLDACGSDHRALVELLLSVGDDVRASLAVAPRAEDHRWETRRAPLVHRLVATRYLQTDIARWLVDCWAFAMGLLDRVPASPSLQHVENDASPAHGLTHPDATIPARGSPWRRGGLGVPSTTPAAATSRTPTSRSHPQSRGTGAPGAFALATAFTPRPRMSPAELAKIRRMERTGFLLLVCAGVISFAGHAYVMLSKPLDRQRVADAATERAITSPSATGAGRMGTRPTSASASASAAVADTSLDVAMPMPASTPTTNGLTDAIEPGGTIPGRYRVTHEATSVTGGEGCDQVAGALAQQQPSVETVERAPGSSIIRLTSRALTGSVLPEGQFVIGPDSGVTDGVRWTFVMRGQFTRAGFVAQSQKTTDAILKWHSMRSCAVVANLVGTRLSP